MEQYDLCFNDLKEEVQTYLLKAGFIANKVNNKVRITTLIKESQWLNDIDTYEDVPILANKLCGLNMKIWQALDKLREQVQNAKDISSNIEKWTGKQSLDREMIDRLLFSIDMALKIYSKGEVNDNDEGREDYI